METKVPPTVYDSLLLRSSLQNLNNFQAAVIGSTEVTSYVKRLLLMFGIATPPLSRFPYARLSGTKPMLPIPARRRFVEGSKILAEKRRMLWLLKHLKSP